MDVEAVGAAVLHDVARVSRLLRGGLHGAGDLAVGHVGQTTEEAVVVADDRLQLDDLGVSDGAAVFAHGHTTDAGGGEDTGRLAGGTGAVEDGGVEGLGVSADDVVPEDALDIESGLLQQVVGVAGENLEGVRLHVDGAEALFLLGGRCLLGEPLSSHTATLDDAGVALHTGDVADTKPGAEHGVTQRLDVGPLRDGGELGALGRGGDVVVVEGADAQKDGRDTDTGKRLTGGAHLLVGLLVHLGLKAGQARLACSLAEELRDGEALQLLLLGGGQRALREESPLGGLFGLSLAELIRERFNLGGQSFALGGVGLCLQGVNLGAQVSSNFVRFSHCFF